jgi:hypothetical protein
MQCTGISCMIRERLSSSFFDFCFFTCKVAEVEYTCPTNFTSLVNFNFLKGRHVYREDTLYTYST